VLKSPVIFTVAYTSVAVTSPVFAIGITTVKLLLASKLPPPHLEATPVISDVPRVPTLHQPGNMSIPAESLGASN